jgi:TRAP-type C4-dicarboxylate transport system permease small subunit
MNIVKLLGMILFIAGAAWLGVQYILPMLNPVAELVQIQQEYQSIPQVKGGSPVLQSLEDAASGVNVDEIVELAKTVIAALMSIGGLILLYLEIIQRWLENKKLIDEGKRTTRRKKAA